MMKITNPPNPLWRLLKARQWDTTISLLETVNAIRDQAQERLSHASATLYPLHYALLESAPEKLILALLKAYPVAAKHHYQHDLPLHLAVKRKRPLSLIEKLSDVYPDSIQQKINGKDLTTFASKYYAAKNSNDKKVLNFFKSATAPSPNRSSNKDTVDPINVMKDQSLIIESLASLSESKENHSEVLATHSSSLLDIKKNQSTILQNQEHLLTMVHGMHRSLLTITDKIEEGGELDDQSHGKPKLNDRLCENNNVFIDNQDMTYKEMKANLVRLSKILEKNGIEVPEDIEKKLVTDQDFEGATALSETSFISGQANSEQPLEEDAPEQSLEEDVQPWRRYRRFHTPADFNPIQYDEPRRAPCENAEKIYKSKFDDAIEQPCPTYAQGSYYDESVGKLVTCPNEKLFNPKIYYDEGLTGPVKDLDDQSYQESYYDESVDDRTYGSEDESLKSERNLDDRFYQGTYEECFDDPEQQSYDTEQYFDDRSDQGTDEKSENYFGDRAEENLDNESDQGTCEKSENFFGDPDYRNHNESSVKSEKNVDDQSDQGTCEKSENFFDDADYQNQSSDETGENFDDQGTYYEKSSECVDDRQGTHSENLMQLRTHSDEISNTMQVKHQEPKTENTPSHPLPEDKPAEDDDESFVNISLSVSG